MIAFVETLPRTPNGKKNREAVRALDPAWLAGSAWTAPKTALERKLAEIFAEVLGVGSIGAEDNFFDLGGHSLNATRLVSRIADELNVDLPKSSLQRHSTVSSLARLIEESDRKTAQNRLQTIAPDAKNRHEPFPLTDIQGAYLLARSAGFGAQTAHRYVEIDCINFEPERFKSAWQRLVERHDMLRTIILRDGRQQILKSIPPYDVPIVDLTENISDLAYEARLMEARKRLSHEAFAPEQWPLFDIMIHRLAERLFRIHISIDMIVCDGKSFRVLLSELAALYQEPTAPLSNLQLSFRDVVLARIEQKKSSHYQQSMAFWMNRIKELPPAPDLPITVQSDPMTPPVFRRRQHVVEPDAWRRIQRLCAAERVTPTSFLATVYAEVLSTWATAPQFTLNLTTLNRPPLHPEIDQLVGDFTAVTLLGIDFSSKPDFKHRVRDVQEQLWKALDHDDVDGVVLMRELVRAHPERASAGVMPYVFTSMLNIHSSGKEVLNALIGRYVFRQTQTPQLWIDNNVIVEGDSLVLNWDTVEDRFPKGMLDAMFDAYCDRMRKLSEDPAHWTEKARLVPRPQLEQRASLNIVEETASDETLVSLIETRAEKQPNEPALIAAERTLSYADLMREADLIADDLIAGGAGPDVPVAAIMEKGWEQLVALLGILKSRAAYVPIDPNFPKNRIQEALEHAGVRLALTQPWLTAKLELPKNIRALEVRIPDRAEPSGMKQRPRPKPDDLAYIIYTSGTTGAPKGVAISHRSAVNTVTDINERFKVGPHDRVLAISSFNFDLSVFDNFGTLAAGGTLVMPEPRGARDPAYMLRLASEKQVTIWNSVPMLMQAMIDYIEAGTLPNIPKHLRLVMLSGDWIPIKLPDRVRSHFKSTKVISLGGPTETTIWSISYPIHEVDPAWQSIPYGKPMRNHTYHILKDSLEPCPVWVPGEIYVGGVGLARCYWNDPKRTDAYFFIHPETEERLYRSGDVGRYLPDGNIEILGRKDFQVKIRGYRIELGEIESTLERHTQVRRATVVAKGDQGAAKHLTAFVALRSGPGPKSGSEASARDVTNEALGKELRLFVRQFLPDYMTPSFIIAVDEMPMSANGKVDRKAIALLEAKPGTASASVGEAGSKIQSVLVEAWKEMLAVPEVKVEDNFFDLGGDSIGLIKLQRLIREKLSVEVPIAKLFELQTIKDLAGYLQQTCARETLQESPDAQAKRAAAGAQLGDLIDYKLGEPTIRQDVQGHRFVQLQKPGLDGSFIDRFSRRKSHRQYSTEKVSFDDLSGWLSSLMQVKLPDYVLPKYQYPSAGNLNPIQIYLFAKPDRIDRLRGGFYYYHPKEHRLIELSSDANIISSECYGDKNKPLFESSAMALFLVGRMMPIFPVYGELSRDFCLLEAGHIGQLLMEQASDHSIGICPIGRFIFDKIRPALALEPTDFLAYNFVGGRISGGGNRRSIEVRTADSIQSAAGAPRHSPPISKGLRFVGKESTVTSRIFCFPHAGGSAQMFQKWPDSLRRNIELCGVQHPGHGDRSGETALHDVASIASAAFEAMRSRLDKPYALLGSSFGAIVAFELARLMRKENVPLPAHFIVVGGRPPSAPPLSLGFDSLPDDAFLDAMSRRFGALPEEFKGSPDFRKAFMPSMRADMNAFESYRYSPAPAFEFPITVIWGEKDAVVTKDEIGLWRRETQGAYEFKTHPGGHYFISMREEQQVINILSSNINQMLL